MHKVSNNINIIVFLGFNEFGVQALLSGVEVWSGLQKTFIALAVKLGHFLPYSCHLVSFLQD